MLEQTVGGRRTQYRDAARTLRTIVADAETAGVDHLAITGDLTAYATDDEFDAARLAIEPFGSSSTRCSVVPGNHDYFTPGAVRSSRFERHFGHLLTTDAPEHQVVGPYPFAKLVGDDTAVIGLLSAQLPPVPGLAYGRIGTAQLNALLALRDDHRFRHRMLLVLVHHAPLRASGRPDHPRHGLLDWSELLRVIPGPRRAVLHGHLHERFHLPATATRPHLICAGSSTRRGSEGYWTLDIADGELRSARAHTVGTRSDTPP
jgi:3',5'-cyclic AMP phosphodiesterase CpdA